MIPTLWAFDYILGFLFLLLIYFVAFVYRSNKMEKDGDYKYFMYGLSAKIFGGLGFLFLSLYYWKGGDTFTYYVTADGFTSMLLENPLRALGMLFSPSSSMNWYEYKFAYGHHKFLNSPASFTVVKVTALINLFCFRSYLTTTMIFSTLSFLGVWNMYYVFCKIYSHLKKQLLFAFFFIPSVVLWGSGILKDTITIAAVGWLVYSFMNIVILKRKKTLSIILIVLATISIALLKPYILYILYPSLFIWVQSNLKNLISNNLIRNLISPFIALTLVISSFFLSKEISQNAGKYNVNELEHTLEGFQNWHTIVSETKDQSGYTLGEMELTPIGILKKAPEAIEVTFFRPYPWEVNNASTLLGALEGMVLLLFSVWLLLRYRIKLFKLIYKNKDILFLMIFALIFGVVVGISSYNFGALSRYKMPAQMFYVIALILISDKTIAKDRLRHAY